MLRIEMLIGATTHYFASEPLDYNDRYYQPRIINPYEIQRIFSYSDKTGSRKRTCGIRLSNHDQYFNTIESVSGLLNQKFTLYYQDGTGSTQKMVGKCTNINGFGTEVDLTISEIGYEYLTDPIPDAGIAYDYYSEFGVNDNWNTIPICIGTCNRVSVMWADRVNSRFIICSGPIKAIKKVYFDKTVVYDSTAGLNGYKATPESINIKVRAFRGSGSILSPEVVDGVTSSYPGFAYIEIYDEATGLAVDPVLTDNTIATIFVDVEGITDLTDTVMERNPANVIYQLLTNARTGYRGFGLGISTSDVDFTDAILECTTQGFVIDGMIDQKNDAGIWFDELVKTCRGSLVEEGGKIKLIIDKVKTVVEAAFDESGETGYNCNLEPWSEPPLDQQINRLRLFYDRNHESGTWGKSPDFNEESYCKDPNLKNNTHATRIMKWNTNTLELQFLKDDTAAHKLAQYYFKRDILQLKEISFVTENTIPTTLDAGSLITITASKYGWSSKQFLIQEISRTDGEIKIKAKEYDSSIFTFTAITPGTDPTQDTTSAYSIPSKPTLNGISSDVLVANDGTVQIRLCACIAKAANSYATLFYRKPNGCPDSSFSFFGQTLTNYLTQMWDGGPGCFNVRAVAVNSVGVYSPIDIAAGDKHYYGQPGAESYICVSGDAVAPNVPTIASATGLLTISLALGFAGGKPADFDYFSIKRRRSDGCCESIISDQWRGAVYVDSSPQIIQNYTDEFEYAAFAVDTSGNCSAYSAWTAPVKPIQVDNKDITANQIIGKDFRTACGVGDGCCISGIRFDCTSIRGYCQDTLNFCLNASTGLMFAQNATIAGCVTATCGQIGGWNLGACCIYSNDIIMHSSGCIYYSCFASGLRGWKIACDGNAEFNNITIRGTLRSSSFVYDEVNTVGGQLFIANSGNLHAETTTADVIGNCFTICVAHRSVYSQIFVANDVLRFKTFNGTNVYDTWATVVSYTCFAGYGQYVVQMNSGSTSITIPKGTTLVSYGAAATTSGGIFLSGQGNCSPYIDVFQSTACPWTSITPKVRLGRLDGIAGMPANTFGLWTDNGCIVGGTIQSNNYCTTAGSCIDLTTGTFAFGGSSAPKLCWNGTTLVVNGTVCAAAGTIGGFCIAANCLYSTPAAGCGVGMSSCTTSGAIAFWAGCSTVASAPFRVTNTGVMVASNATVSGTLYSTAGCIGCFTLNSGYLSATTATGGIYMYSTTYNTIYTMGCGGCGSYAMHGRMYWDGSWNKCAYGFSVTNGCTGSLAFGAGYANSGTVTLPDASTVACGCPFFWVGTCCANMKFVAGQLSIHRNDCIGSGCWICMRNIFVCCAQVGLVYLESCSPMPLMVISCYVGLLDGTTPTAGALFCGKSSTTSLSSRAYSGVAISASTLCGSCALTAYAKSDYAVCAYALGNFGGFFRGTCYGICTNASINYGVYGYAACCFGVMGFAWGCYAVSGNLAYAVCSSKNIKHIVGYDNVLNSIRNIRIPRYQYTDENSTGFNEFIGPLAEEIQQEFGLTFSNDMLYTVDGIALKGVQELDCIVQEQKDCISTLHCSILSLQDRILQLECKLG